MEDTCVLDKLPPGGRFRAVGKSDVNKSVKQYIPKKEGEVGPLCMRPLKKMLK
jgi:hypothetical protein